MYTYTYTKTVPEQSEGPRWSPPRLQICAGLGLWLKKWLPQPRKKIKFLFQKHKIYLLFLFKTHKKSIKTNKKEDLCPLSFSGLSELHSSVALYLTLLTLNVLNLCKSSGDKSLYYYRSLL